MLLDVHKFRTVISYWWFYQPIHYWCITIFLASVQFSGSVMSWFFVTPWSAAHQASLSITNSWSLLKLMSINWWCHPIISSSVVPFSCLLSFPASGSFPVNQFFPSGGQSIRVSASVSVLPMNIQNWFTGKDPDAGKDCRQEEKVTTEDEMVGWHHRLNGHEFE